MNVISKRADLHIVDEAAPLTPGMMSAIQSFTTHQKLKSLVQRRQDLLEQSQMVDRQLKKAIRELADQEGLKVMPRMETIISRFS